MKNDSLIADCIQEGENKAFRIYTVSTLENKSNSAKCPRF